MSNKFIVAITALGLLITSCGEGNENQHEETIVPETESTTEISPVEPEMAESEIVAEEEVEEREIVVEDIDGNGYSSIFIGEHEWMAENLATTTFRNGDPIKEVKSQEEWEEAGKNEEPAWCYYDNDTQMGVEHGVIYNWYALVDSRGLAPKGWHIATDEEWAELTESYSSIGKKMKTTSGWKNGGNGTNEIGFNGTPGGFRYAGGSFMDLGKTGYWWCMSKADGDPIYRNLTYDLDGVIQFNCPKRSGLYVRCVKD